MNKLNLRCNLFVFLMMVMSSFSFLAYGQEKAATEYHLSAGDVVRVAVFQSADMQVDSPVSQSGSINYPLVGNVEVAGLTLAAAQQKLAGLLKQGGFDIGLQQLTVTLIKMHDPLAATAATEQVDSKPKGDGDKADYRLGAGDGIRITVFQNPDLSLESRVSDTGTITYPLIGTVELGGLTIGAAEQKLGRMLKDGGFVVDPQLSITLLQVRGNQVSVLGQVNRPGRYPLEQANMKVTDILALAGGIIPSAADSVILVGMREGKMVRKTIDIVGMLFDGKQEEDISVQNGDIFYVNRAPVFYIHGEVQRPGSYRIERDMTVMQALAQGGGITQRGTVRGLRIHRRNDKTGKTEEVELGLLDPIRPDDVIYVRESWF